MSQDVKSLTIRFDDLIILISFNSKHLYLFELSQNPLDLKMGKFQHIA